MQLLMDALQFGASVFVLFLLAGYLLFDPVRKLLKERQEGIRKNIEDAETDKKSAAQLKAEYEEKLKGIDKEAEQILSEARQKALKNEAKMIEEAKEEATGSAPLVEFRRSPSVLPLPPAIQSLVDRCDALKKGIAD